MFTSNRNRRRSQHRQMASAELLENRRVLSGIGMEMGLKVEVPQQNLLLPAVQKVREAASSTTSDLMQKVRFAGVNDPAFQPEANGIIAVLVAN